MPHVTGTLAEALASADARLHAARAGAAAGAPPSRVAPRVFVGGAAAARDGPALAAASITHVVNAAPSLPNWFEGGGGGGGGDGAPPRSYLRVDVFDGGASALDPHFAPVTSFIDAALAEHPGNAVLVHCVAGASRSVTLAAAWLASSSGATADAALAAVAAARPVAAPHPGFVDQLRAWVEGGCGKAAAPSPPSPLRRPLPRAASAGAVRSRSPDENAAPARLPSAKSAAALASLPASDRVEGGAGEWAAPSE